MKTKYRDERYRVRKTCAIWRGQRPGGLDSCEVRTPHGIATIIWWPNVSARITFVFQGYSYRRWPIVKTRRGAVRAATRFVREIVGKGKK